MGQLDHLLPSLPSAAQGIKLDRTEHQATVLKKHLNDKHSEFTLKICMSCKRDLAWKTHYEPKPLVCPLCDKRTGF